MSGKYRKSNKSKSRAPRRRNAKPEKSSPSLSTLLRQLGVTKPSSPQRSAILRRKKFANKTFALDLINQSVLEYNQNEITLVTMKDKITKYIKGCQAKLKILYSTDIRSGRKQLVVTTFSGKFVWSCFLSLKQKYLGLSKQRITIVIAHEPPTNINLTLLNLSRSADQDKIAQYLFIGLFPKKMSPTLK